MKSAPGSSTAGHSANNQPIDKSRRLLLKMMGICAGVTASKIAGANRDDIAGELIQASKFLINGVNITLYRPQDLLELDIAISGFTRSADFKNLTRAGSPSYMRVEFAPQSICEQAYKEGTNPEFPAKSFLSGKSRLVFEIPSSINTIPLTAKGLLDWDKFRPVINKRAQSSVIFTVQDNIGNYNNVLLKDVQVIGTPNINTTTPVNNNTQPVNNTRPVITQPVNTRPTNDRPLNNTRPVIREQQPVQNDRRRDTTRQVQSNREVRSATRDESKIITAREAPADTRVQPNTNIAGALFNLKVGKTPRPVDEDETAIEFPYRMFISPNQYAAWVHEFKLKLREDLQNSVSKTYELWHSRLSCKNCDNQKDLSGATNPLKTVRALWAVDANGTFSKKPVPNQGFVTSIYNDQRHSIVHESSNYELPNNFSPKPIQVQNLMLSTLGAWFDAEMTVSRESLKKAGLLGSLDVLKWKHIATLARDHYVEIVQAGNMWPFGHEASIVQITERKPEIGYALNRQRHFIVINEVEKKYNPYNPDNGNFKSFPFSTIRFVTTTTPSLGEFKAFCSGAGAPGQQFVPTTLDRQEIKFKLVGYDLDGNDVDFEMPLVFISTAVSYMGDSPSPNLSNIGKLLKCYNQDNVVANKITFRNQKMSLSRSSTPGDTTFEVQSILFQGHSTLSEEPWFRPEVKELDIFISAVENITGKREAQKVKLVDDEMNKPEAQRKNKGKVFAELIKSTAVNFNGSGNKTGGSLSPNFSITALSKSLGAIGGDVSQAQKMNFDPTKFFDSSAKLFGVIELGQIISKLDNVAAVVSGDSVKSPFPALKNIETEDANITQYIWNAATLKAADFGFAKFVPKGGGPGKIVIETNLYRYKDPAKPTAFTISSTLSDFGVEIAGIASVDFKRIGFYTGANAKTDFTIDMAETPLRFLGALSFVNDLQKYIPADGFSDPPFLDISTSGIKTGYTLALPDIQLGAFTLRHINLGATVTLPFTGDPMSLRFNFCEKQQPFTLTVSGLGGGGFFAIEFDMKGLRSLEAALEFGAAVSINLGVASGAVSVMGGIYFMLSVTSDGKKEYRLEGYVRINGALSVLGIITVSVEFLLTLAADLGAGDKVERVWGEASLKVKIEIFMFSKTVSMKVQREFAGAGADPTFAMLISPNEWELYCDAFAA